MPRLKADQKTLILTMRDVAVRCTRCGFTATIGDDVALAAASAVKAAYQKLRGEGKCEPKA